MSSFEEHLAEDRRLVILRTLRETHGSANDSVLHSAVSFMGHRISREQVRDDMRFLLNHGLITDEWVGPVWVAKLTRRGSEVAQGTLHIQGIKRPSIGI